MLFNVYSDRKTLEPAECRRPRAHSGNVPLIRKDAYDCLQSLQPTSGDDVARLSHLNIITTTSAVAAVAAAVDDDDDDNRSAG